VGPCDQRLAARVSLQPPPYVADGVTTNPEPCLLTPPGDTVLGGNPFRRVHETPDASLVVGTELSELIDVPRYECRVNLDFQDLLL